jgi:hypothetical protein
MPREGSFELAFLGRARKVQETAVAAGRQSFALKRILFLVPVPVLVLVLVLVLVTVAWSPRRKRASRA